jgi:nitrogen fixation protein NifB
VLLCARIGFTPWRALQDAGVQPDSEHAGEPIGPALQAVHAVIKSTDVMIMSD